jgi:hypothetical protein
MPLRCATFKVRLPVLPVPESVIESSRTPVMSAPQGSVAGVKMLIVNDDGDGREVMTAHLEQHGATVLTALAREALDMSQRQHVDVLRPADARCGRVGGEHLARAWLDEHPRRTVPLGRQHEQGSPVGTSKRAGKAAAVKLDPL